MLNAFKRSLKRANFTLIFHLFLHFLESHVESKCLLDKRFVHNLQLQQNGKTNPTIGFILTPRRKILTFRESSFPIDLFISDPNRRYRNLWSVDLAQVHSSSSLDDNERTNDERIVFGGSCRLPRSRWETSSLATEARLISDTDVDRIHQSRL